MMVAVPAEIVWMDKSSSLDPLETVSAGLEIVATLGSEIEAPMVKLASPGRNV